MTTNKEPYEHWLHKRRITPRKPRRVKSCPYCGHQIGFEWGNYYAHVNACKRKAEEAKNKTV